MPSPPLPGGGRGDDGLPDEPHGLVSKPGAAHCPSLREWLRAGVGSEGAPITRSATLPSGYTYDFSKAVGRVALRHANGIVIQDRPLVLGASPSGEYILGFHYCSAEGFRRTLEDPDRWPTLHLASTAEREPAALGVTAAEAAATLAAEGLLGGVELQSTGAACCIPVRVPRDWLQVPVKEAAGAGAGDAGGAVAGAEPRRSKKEKKHASGEGSRSSSHGRSGRSRSRSSSSSEGDGEQRRQPSRERKREDAGEAAGEARLRAAGLGTLFEEEDEAEQPLGGSLPAEAPKKRQGLVQQYARAVEEDSSRNPTSQRGPPEEGAGGGADAVASAQQLRAAEAFIRASMFQWTSLRLPGGGECGQELAWDFHSGWTAFDIFARTEGASQGGESLAVSVNLFGAQGQDKAAKVEAGGVSLTLALERTACGVERAWVLAGTGVGKKAGRMRTGLAACKPGPAVLVDFWLTVSKSRSEGASGVSVRMGEGLSAGRGELLRLDVSGVGAAAAAPRVRLASVGEAPWEAEMGHTARLPWGSARDLEAAGGNPNLQDASGRSALVHATLANDLKAMQALLYCKANVHARDRTQCTAMHHAVHAGHPGAIEQLLERGASVFVRNRSGCTPKDLARIRWSPRLPGEGEDWESEGGAEAKERARRGKEVLAALARGARAVRAREA